MTRFQFRSALASARALALGTLLFAGACASPQIPPPEEFQSAPAEGEYVLGTGDVVRVSVWKNPELSIDTPVRPDGKISVALIDDVQAAGLTAAELKDIVTAELDEYISSPDVTVIVLQSFSKRVSVVGEVARPGPVLLATELRVLDVISATGGFGPFANRSDVRIIRYIEGRELEYRFDFDAYVAGDAPGTNIVLHPGDTIVVPD